ncbi:MAG: SURF1 family protein [Paracoccaceae bacterium]|jgi:surfeit locus 1 family protein|nr:SURF1 family protein [Paracoccaceae bacterium]
MRFLLPLIFGLLGTVVLVGLGVWQMQRLDWKEAILADIDARITAAPVALPDQPDPQADRYLPVTVTGVLQDPAIRVLVSQKQVGAGYRIIRPMQVGERLIMVDLGFLPIQSSTPAVPSDPVTVQGNLHWPDEVDSYTPAPDLDADIWFARDLSLMADHLGTAPVLVVARSTSLPDSALAPLPVDTSGIPNDHLGYAVTWFGLAIVWVMMTGFFLWRIRKPAKG